MIISLPIATQLACLPAKRRGWEVDVECFPQACKLKRLAGPIIGHSHATRTPHPRPEADVIADDLQTGSTPRLDRDQKRFVFSPPVLGSSTAEGYPRNLPSLNFLGDATDVTVAAGLFTCPA